MTRQMSEPRTEAGRLFVAYEDANDEDAGNSLGHLMGIRHWTIRDVVLAIEAEAAALPAALDVERLARALNDTDHADCIGWDNPKAGCRGYYRRMAKAALAAAYAVTDPDTKEAGE